MHVKIGFLMKAICLEAYVSYMLQAPYIYIFIYVDICSSKETIIYF